jgi:hypothetical protein
VHEVYVLVRAASVRAYEMYVLVCAARMHHALRPLHHYSPSYACSEYISMPGERSRGGQEQDAHVWGSASAARQSLKSRFLCIADQNVPS